MEHGVKLSADHPDADNGGHGHVGLALILCAVVAALLIARRPTALTAAQFWAEDGVVFFRDAWVCGATAAGFQYAGYFHLFPRLVATLSVLAPVSWAPTLFALAALLAPFPVIALLTSERLKITTWQRVHRRRLASICYRRRWQCALGGRGRSRWRTCGPCCQPSP